MSSLDYTYEHLDEWVPRDALVAPTIIPKRTAILALDVQKLITDPSGAAYVKSVGGAPEGKDVIAPINAVLKAARAKGIPVFWSLWGLRGDGWDAGVAAAKWPGLKPGKPESPASWGNRDAELDDHVKPASGELVFEKHRFSSFYNTHLDEWLRERDIDTLVIIGVTSANCAHATAIDGWNKNYKIIILADTTTAVPHPRPNQPLGTGQHWEALRNIQLNYGDVRTSREFIELIK
ncbi:MAG: cysteine hydrolase family protein [Gemmataceae bacterium]